MPAALDLERVGNAELKRQERVRYYVGVPSENRLGHLYDFCVDILGFDALSESFHGPELRKWDSLDMRRFRVFEGYEDHGGEPLDQLTLWARGHIKTWCARARVIRYYLWNPETTVTWWHAVEAMALGSGEAIADMMQRNLKLRALFPQKVLPAMNSKKFFAGGRFNLNSRRIGDAPSFVAMGAGGEATGAHSLVGVLDDFVGWNDVVDSQMPKKKQFYQGTVSNVVLRTSKASGWKDALGTHWSPDDPYVDWRQSTDWLSSVRGALETDGKPDDGGKPVYLSEDQIEKERREQGPIMFPLQMLNDPRSSGEKPWKREREPYLWISRKEALAGPAFTVVLSDPAPAKIGSADSKSARVRGDGTKDYWANAVFRIRRNGLRFERILVDGSMSRDWDVDEGFGEICRLKRVRGATHHAIEKTGQAIALYEKSMEQAARRHGVSRSSVELEGTYKGGAKNVYFGALCSAANSGEFLICRETCNQAFLDMFLSQARDWNPISGATGGNGLRYDDCANVVSFATDPAFSQFAPQVHKSGFAAYDPFDEEDEQDAGFEQRSRYCGI